MSDPSMEMASVQTASAADPRDFVLVRLINAPRHTVFRAWTVPELLKQWWGPEHFTCTVCEIDLRVGGRYRWGICAPGGEEYLLSGKFLEIDAPSRLVYTNEMAGQGREWYDMFHRMLGADDTPDATADATTTITFEERGNQTLLTVTARFTTPEVLAVMVKTGMGEAWDSTLGKLERLVKGS